MGKAKNDNFTKDKSLSKLGGLAKPTREALTLQLIKRFTARNQDGISIEELMFDVAQDEKESVELRLKAAFKLADLVFPKTAQVEIEIEDGNEQSLADMDDKIAELLAKAKVWEDKDSDDKD